MYRYTPTIQAALFYMDGFSFGDETETKISEALKENETIKL